MHYINDLFPYTLLVHQNTTLGLPIRAACLSAFRCANKFSPPFETVASNATYFYYSMDIDSVITMNNEKEIVSKRYFKYNDVFKIFGEDRFYNDFGQEQSYYIKNWEYNEGAYRFVRLNTICMLPVILYGQIKQEYDDLNKLTKTEAFDKVNVLISYSRYFYDDNGIMSKTETFDINNNLKT